MSDDTSEPRPEDVVIDLEVQSSSHGQTAQFQPESDDEGDEQE